MRRNYQFQDSARICVIGIGGGGSNAVTRMITEGMRGTEFVTINTDAHSLNRSKAATRIQIGKEITHGLGTGGNPVKGERAAYKAVPEIRAAIRGSDMIFITTGMGGGTGTGASPVIAEIAQELGILTIAIVTHPFTFEGSFHAKTADEGIEKLKNRVDSLIVIPNDRLLDLCDENTGLNQAFLMADDVLREGVQAISDLVNKPGLINLDFADVRSVMSQKGATLMAVGRASGPNRAKTAAEQAIHSPLLGLSIYGAKAALVNITAGPDLYLWEVEQATQLLQSSTHPDANFILGTTVDETMGDELGITVIATGFDQDQLRESYSISPLKLKIPAVQTPAAVQKAMIPQPTGMKFSFGNYTVPAFLQSH